MTKRAAPPLLLRLREALRGVADPARAPAMQAYMKSTMPYLGVPMPKVRATCREVFASYPFRDADTWRADVLAVWHAATYREERYAAVALSGHRRAKSFQTLDALPMFEEMIVTGAWWDFVDELAHHRIGPLLDAHPRPMRRTMLAWSESPNLWIRRTSILCQLGRRDAVDRELLYACIRPSLSSKEFFLRKAIGWALRSLAWYDPDEVVRYVEEHDAELHSLSKREALKNVKRLGAETAKPRRAPLRRPATPR